MATHSASQIRGISGNGGQTVAGLHGSRRLCLSHGHYCPVLRLNRPRFPRGSDIERKKRPTVRPAFSVCRSNLIFVVTLYPDFDRAANARPSPCAVIVVNGICHALRVESVSASKIGAPNRAI